MKNEGDQEQESLIPIEDVEYIPPPKLESPNSVKMYILVIDITYNYEDQK